MADWMASAALGASDIGSLRWTHAMCAAVPACSMPKAPPSIPRTQSPNYATTWSASQNPRCDELYDTDVTISDCDVTRRSNAMRGPRFEQTNMDFQPQPLSAMALIAEEPIRLMEKRIAECDGGAWAWNEKQATSDVSLARTGGGSLGHPKVFINLDKPGPKACS